MIDTDRESGDRLTATDADGHPEPGAPRPGTHDLESAADGETGASRHVRGQHLVDAERDFVVAVADR